MPSVTFAPIQSGPFAPGDIIEFQLITSDDFPDFYDTAFDLTYNSDLLSYQGTDFVYDDIFEVDVPEPDDPEGPITTLSGIQGGSFGALSGGQVVATLSFEVLAPGDASVLLAPSESFGRFFGDISGDPLGIDGPPAVELVINVPPVAVEDTATVLEDGSVEIDVLANDSDPGGAAPTIESFTQAGNGTVTETANGLTYTPDDDYFGDDSFEYTIIDEAGTTATATVSVTVTSVNDGPVAVDDERFLDKNGSVQVTVLANDTDVENDMLSIVSFEGGSNGTVSQSGNTLTYLPSVDFVGLDSFTYVVSDGNGGTDTGTVNIQVNETNVDPVAVNDTATVNEDGSVEILVLANDTDDDNDELSVGSFTDPGNGTVTRDGNVLTYTPDDDYNGPDSFTYQANDGNGGTALASVNITVNPVNDAPVASDDAASVDQNGSVEIDVLANDSDIDGDTLTVIAGAAANGSVTQTDGGLTYTPNAGYTGLDSFTYTVDDGNGGTDTATVNLAVNGVTLVYSGSDSVKLGEEVAFVLTTSEGFEEFVAIAAALNYNADDLRYLRTEFNDGFDVGVVPPPASDASGPTPISGIQGGSVIPDTSFSGEVQVATFFFEALSAGETTVSISGDMGTFFLNDAGETVFDGTAETTVTLNSAPDALDDEATIDEDGSISLTALLLSNDSDLNDDPISIVSVGPAENGIVSFVDGEVEYTADKDFFGQDQFEYTISDGGLTDTATVTVNVTSVNDAPVFTTSETSFDVVEGGSQSVFTASAFDVEGSDVVFSLQGEESDPFQVSATTGEVSFDDLPVFNDGGDNVYTFDVIASDGELTATQSVTVSVLKDTDGDLVADIQDNAIFVQNADQRDSDGDGFGNIIDADFDQDYDVDIFDLLFFRNAYGSEGLVDGVDPEANADFTGDGNINISDLAVFRGLFGDNLSADDSGLVDTLVIA